MHFLANVPHVETSLGLEFYTPHAHVSVDFPFEDSPQYWVLVGIGSGRSRGFRDFASAMDYASRCLKQSEPA
jgi:hypothetical protein